MNNDEKIYNKMPFNVYCNGIEVSMGRFDFSFMFSHSSPKGEEFLGHITMSPEHAKA
jgi:hypothetical protein